MEIIHVYKEKEDGTGFLLEPVVTAIVSLSRLAYHLSQQDLQLCECGGRGVQGGLVHSLLCAKSPEEILGLKIRHFSTSFGIHGDSGSIL